MMAPAAATNAIVPSPVSIRASRSHRGVIRLSITFDCWKKICHGEIVVPISAISSSSAGLPG